MQPLKFTPILKQTIWGGGKIIKRKHLPAALTNVGESWELSSVEGSESVCTTEGYAGMSISQLIEKHGAELVGKHILEKFGTRLPLLIKFIDANRDLSIQVHPGNEMARRIHGGMGKSEMWYVVDATPEAHLLSGLNRSITPEEYKQRVANDTLCDVVNNYYVRRGDVFHLPAGRIHSIGAGCMMAEIQQTSDITYRIYDFNRLDANGNPRQLHTELAAEAIDYTTLSDYRTHYAAKDDERTLLVESEEFTTSMLSLTKPFKTNYESLDSYTVLICVGGSCTIESEGNAPTSLSAYETVMIPACTKEITIVPKGNVQLLETHP